MVSYLGGKRKVLTGNILDMSRTHRGLYACKTPSSLVHFASLTVLHLDKSKSTHTYVCVCLQRIPAFQYLHYYHTHPSHHHLQHHSLELLQYPPHISLLLPLPSPTQSFHSQREWPLKTKVRSLLSSNLSNDFYPKLNDWQDLSYYPPLSCSTFFWLNRLRNFETMSLRPESSWLPKYTTLSNSWSVLSPQEKNNNYLSQQFHIIHSTGEVHHNLP